MYDVEKNLYAVRDPAYKNTTGPSLRDASTKANIFRRIVPSGSPGQYNGVGPSCYNTGSNFTFNPGSDFSGRCRLDKCFLKLTYQACNVAVPSPYAAIDPNQVSIPWNPIAALISMTSYTLSAASPIIEQLTLPFGHGNMVKILSRYTRPALEGSSAKFFTPTVESTRDVLAGLSPESAVRAQRNLVRDATGGIQIGSKIILLGDIFESLATETGIYLSNFILSITFKTPDQILFHTAAATGINNFYIIGLELYLITDEVEQLENDKIGKLIKSGEALNNISYRYYDTRTDSYVPGKSFPPVPSKNLQGAVLMFPSTTCADAIGINPFQYCYNSTPTLDTGVSSYYHNYGGRTFPLQTTIVQQVDKSANTDLFANWLLLTRLLNDRVHEGSIQFFPNIGFHGPTYDTSNYVFFPAVMHSPDAAPRIESDTPDHTVTVLGGGNATAVIVRILVRALSVGPDFRISVLQ